MGTAELREMETREGSREVYHRITLKIWKEIFNFRSSDRINELHNSVWLKIQSFKYNYCVCSADGTLVKIMILL